MAYQNHLISASSRSDQKLYGIRRVANCCQYLLPHLPSNAHILDIGCGPGSITADLAAFVSPGGGSVIGIDSDAGVVAQANATYQDQINTGTKLSFQTGDALKLPFPDESFDVVHGHAIIMHLSPEAVAAFREIRRVIRPGGFVAIRDCNFGVVVKLEPEIAALREYWASSEAVMVRIGMDTQSGGRLEESARKAGWGGDGGKVVASQSEFEMVSHLERVKGEKAEEMVRQGRGTREEVERWRDGWEQWEKAEGRRFAIDGREILCWKAE